MTISESVKTCFRKYFTFSGRASRSEYWKFVLFLFLVSIVLVFVSSFLFGPEQTDIFKVTTSQSGKTSYATLHKTSYNAGWLGTLFSIATLIPMFAAAFRRLHDTGRPGWLMLIPVPVTAGSFFAVMYLTRVAVPVDQTKIPAGLDFPEFVYIPDIPAIGFIILWFLVFAAFILTTVLLARKSTPGPNKYGPNSQKVNQWYLQHSS